MPKSKLLICILSKVIILKARNVRSQAHIYSIWYNKTESNPGGNFLESLDIARKAVEAAGEKQALDISLLDVRDVCTFASYFVICSGESERQLQAICDEIEQSLKKEGVRVIHREGTSDSGWMLYDYGDVVIHVFAPKDRDFYQFDELWHKGSPIVRIL